MSPWPKGKKHTPETRQKMREAKRGEKNPVWGKYGEDNPNWRGGRKCDSDGYILIWKPDHPHANCNGCVMEHRLVMEKVLGRHLDPRERVHHINEIRDDNRKENLQLFSSNNEYLVFHKRGGG